jgi:hypothetical protein
MRLYPPANKGWRGASSMQSLSGLHVYYIPATAKKSTTKEVNDYE